MAENINLPNGTFCVLCVGNISVRKNQKMLVDAIAFLDDELKNNIALLLIGGNEAELKAYSEKCGIANAFFTGTVPKKTVYEYLKKADLLAMASLDEGFGLPVVEGYSFGVPAVIPTGVDAFKDLYSEDACIAVDEYSPQAFAEAIQKAHERKWDKQKIIAFSENFNMENCGRKYLSFLKEAANLGHTPIAAEDFKKLILSCD